MHDVTDDDFEKELGELLAVYRCKVALPEFRAALAAGRGPELPAPAGRVAELRPAARRKPLAVLAIAAAIAAIAISGAILLRPKRNDWRVAGSLRTLRSGDVVRATDGEVRLTSRAVGVVDLSAGTTVRLVEHRRRRHVLALDAGTIHAKTSSPPGLFVVETPKARAIDLGCEYVLTVTPHGSGELRVTAGWVELWRGGEQSLVPQGASAAVDVNGDLSAPAFDDAPAPFRVAVRNFERTHDLPTILALARTRDALTLLNLFSRATPDERIALYDRLDQLVPAPPSIVRESVRDWTPGVTEPWWPLALRAANLGPIKKPLRR